LVFGKFIAAQYFFTLNESQYTGIWILHSPITMINDTLDFCRNGGGDRECTAVITMLNDALD
jgi:hypothetical protein